MDFGKSQAVRCVAKRRGINMSESEPEIQNYKKSKRNRHKTECSVIRKTGCGICGSENIASQGVEYCEICGLEATFLVQDRGWFRGCWDRGEQIDCDCVAEIIIRRRMQRYRKLNWIEVGKCLDCGAVRGRFCPNCKNMRLCWVSAFGQKYCQRCGYRRGIK